MSKMSKACFAGVESFAPLAGPANAGEESMEPENTSQPSLNSQYSQTLCRQGVQNEVTQCPKWEKPANAEVKSYSCGDCGTVKIFLLGHIFVFHPFFMNNPGRRLVNINF
jgi:hypothetical protein